ncbi:pirin family protein [Flavihumibacter sp. UBA7668]|uniref:pirin family protein n=1 Tax=Flavihumibacter sp. UBA7668 TaxID=1946542 RepID=UPI0025C44CFC|nr:pirin-like C-terminal cupin domain-containing protein [Flavihumibacter sp. UBA7668]
MAIKRKLQQIDTPPAKPGFLGAGHLARAIIQRDFSESDPFILLMDDMLDKKDNSPAGGPHPHAGFETVTLVLEGEIGEGRHAMKTGDFQLMTAGSGIIHTETIEKPSKLRIMQLWLNLPKAQRWINPGLQELPFEEAPALEEDGLSIRVYSGSIAGLQSPIKNQTPLLLADISMKPFTNTVQQIPANYNTFLYVLEGSVNIGEDEKLLKAKEVGWLNLVGNDAFSELKLQTTEAATRFLLYAAKPLGEPIMSHGPFIADTAEEITQLYRDYRSGKMEHI